MKAKTILTIIVGCGIGGIALALIIISQMKSSEEFGMMQGCFDTSGLFKVSKLSNAQTFDVCEEEETILWDKKVFPLKVSAETNNDYLISSYRNTTNYAIDWVNMSFGFSALRLIDDPAKSDIHINIGAPHGSWGDGAIDSNGATYHYKTYGGMKAKVYTSNVVGESELSAVLVHELGHVLGLGHSEVEESFMHYPTLTMGKIRVRDSNKEIIRSLYMQ